MSFIKRQLYFLLKKISERNHRGYYIEKNQYYIDKYNTCDKKKPTHIIRKEMKELKKYWGVYPLQYFRYNMYELDCKLSLSDMKDYIPDYFAYFLLYPKSFLSRDILCEDKFLFYSICEGLNIPQAKTILLTKNGLFLSDKQDILNLESATDILKQSKAQKIFCKPRYGIGGKGISVFNNIDDKYIDKNTSSVLDLAQFVNQDYIIQEGILQHPIMNDIYPLSINTFRIITEYTEEFGVTILFVLLRMGNKGMEVDNASSGGVYIGVDSVTGQLQKYAMSSKQERYTCHPYTEFKFDGFTIPFWQDIVSFIKNIAFKFSEIKYIGWDVAYTTDGPLIVEANNGPDISILQDCYGGVRKHFQISSPHTYWYSEKYSIKDLQV